MNKRTSRIGMIREHTGQSLPKIKALDEDRGFRRIKRVAKIINLRTAQNKPVFNLRISGSSYQIDKKLSVKTRKTQPGIGRTDDPAINRKGVLQWN